MGRPQEGLSPKVEHFWPHHRSMAKALVFGGLRPRDLADAFGMSAGHISRIIQSPLFVAEVARLEGQVEEQGADYMKDLKLLAGRAVEILSEDLHSSNTPRQMRNKTAFGVLELVMPKAPPPPQKHLHLHQEVGSMSQRDLYDAVMEINEADAEVENA